MRDQRYLVRYVHFRKYRRNCSIKWYWKLGHTTVKDMRIIMKNASLKRRVKQKTLFDEML